MFAKVKDMVVEAEGMVVTGRCGILRGLVEVGREKIRFYATPGQNVRSDQNTKGVQK